MKSNADLIDRTDLADLVGTGSSDLADLVGTGSSDLADRVGTGSSDLADLVDAGSSDLADLVGTGGSDLPDRVGAFSSDWVHFNLVLGLANDLLPVVANPMSKPSRNSKIKALGKVPSQYNKQHEVVGIRNWVHKVITQEDIATWSKQPDYGICVRTRNIRALDVDVLDKDIAQAVHEHINDFLNLSLPARTRVNSPKFLLAFTLPGELTKRILRMGDGNNIEFLATGQQFIAVGTHTSGARYEWPGGLPNDIPTLTADQFEALWASLEEKFATAESIIERPGVIRDRSQQDATATDNVAEYLDQHWPVHDIGRAGERYILCPFDGEHTGESDPTSTAYFPALTGGFELGHFRCLHAHCAHRNDGDFLNAIGYRQQDFDVIEAKKGEPPPLPAFKRDQKGRIESTIENVALAVMRPDFCGIDIRFDQFRDEIMYSPVGRDEWQALGDADYSRLRITLEQRDFKPIGRELIRDVVLLVADDQPFDSAMTWLNSLVWDGVPRVENFVSKYFGAESSGYAKAVSLYLWSALAGRVLSPGCKADMVPILVGPQGCGKSTGVAAISPDPEFFTEVAFSEKDDDLARKMRGCLVAEIGELRGLHTKELEVIKAFVTRTHEIWIPKYREFAARFPRRLVFIGTTNQDEFLADDTGNRRWLPVKVSNVNVDLIRADRDQLWAEAREIFKSQGVIYSKAEELAIHEHEQHTIKDPWVEAVERWLDEPDMLTEAKPRDREYVRANDVLREAISLDVRNISKREEMRIKKTLQSCGFVQVRKYIDGVQTRVFVKLRQPKTT